MLPTLDEKGLLPLGVHEATLEEVSAVFGRMQRTDRRMTLFDRLKGFVEALRKAGIPGTLIVDGSFIMTRVDEPEDIDMVLILPETWDFDADLRPYQYNLVSKKAVKRDLKFDMFTVKNGSEAEARWLNFFSQVSPRWCEKFGWPLDLYKGLLRILL